MTGNVSSYNGRAPKSRVRFRLGVLTCALLLCGSLLASGQEDEASSAERRVPQDRFAIAIGAFVLHHDTRTSYDSRSLGRGTSVDVEDFLGLDKDEIDWRIDGYYRFARKHRLEFGYVDIDREATRSISRQFQFGDDIFTIGTRLESTMNMRLYKLAYSYSIVRSKQIETGLLFGISTYDYELKLFSPGGTLPPCSATR